MFFHDTPSAKESQFYPFRLSVGQRFESTPTVKNVAGHIPLLSRQLLRHRYRVMVPEGIGVDEVRTDERVCKRVSEEVTSCFTEKSRPGRFSFWFKCQIFVNLHSEYSDTAKSHNLLTVNAYGKSMETRTDIVESR